MHTCVTLILLCTVMLSMNMCVSTAHQDSINVSLTLSNSHSAEFDEMKFDEMKFNQHKIIYVTRKNLFEETAVLFCIELLAV